MNKFIFIFIFLLMHTASANSIFFQQSIIELELNGIKRIYFDGPGIPKPTINYTKMQNKLVHIETVSDSIEGAKKLLGFNIETHDTNISFGSPSHSYECEIYKKNGKISFVKGACFNQILFTLPIKTRLEIYYNGQRITPIFFAMTLVELTELFKNTHYDEDRHKHIEDFLHSYKITDTTLILQSTELKAVLEQYIFMPSRLEALTELHKYVEDRGNLETLINQVFIYPSDRRVARKIVGL